MFSVRTHSGFLLEFRMVSIWYMAAPRLTEVEEKAKEEEEKEAAVPDALWEFSIESL